MSSGSSILFQRSGQGGHFVSEYESPSSSEKNCRLMIPSPILRRESPGLEAPPLGNSKSPSKLRPSYTVRFVEIFRDLYYYPNYQIISFMYTKMYQIIALSQENTGQQKTLEAFALDFPYSHITLCLKPFVKSKTKFIIPYFSYNHQITSIYGTISNLIIVF